MKNHLKTVEFLQTHSLQELIDKYHVDIKRHKVYNNLILFKYNMIESPMEEEICQECRGLILNENNNYNQVSVPFYKFWNYGEKLAANIDWNTAKVQIKEDGSMMCLYSHNKKWNVSTSGTPDASGNVNDILNLTFEKLFWDTFNKCGYMLPNPEDNNKTFMFELTSQYNQIVVQHKQEDLHLIGVRNIDDLQELEPEIYGKKYGYKTVKNYNLNTLQEVLDVVKNLNGYEQEGFVICDKNYNRIKIKSPDYILKHRLTEQSTDDFLQIIINGEVSELLTYFPKYKETIEKYINALEKMTKEITEVWENNKEIKDKKTFALNVVKYKCSSILFKLYKKPEDIKTMIKSMMNDNIGKNCIKKLVENYL